MKVSIITVCKNSGSCIERAIRSVVDQTYEGIEYIIIDGGSQDNSVEIFDRYADHIDILVNEPDTGIYNAMNKGLDRCSGEIVYFLNSDDYLFDDQVVADVAGAFKENADMQLLYGNILVAGPRTKTIVAYPDISRPYFYKNTICHQAIFAKKALFDRIGRFDETYVIHADTDWLLRVYFKMREAMIYMDRTVCVFSTGGICGDPVSAEQYKYDRQEISAKYFWEARIKLFIKKLLLKAGIEV